MRRIIIASAVAAGAMLLASLAQPVGAHRLANHEDPVFADGGVMAGSTNGMSFAPDGTLWVANVLGATITQIDPDSGEVLSRLTAAEGVLFPDDVVVGPDSTIYWTEIGLGTVFKRPPGGPTIPLVDVPFGLNSANPLTLSDDGSRLFAAGCYGAPPANNSFVEIDPVNGGILNVLFGPVEGCASNGMSWNDGSLYSPQPFLGEVWRVDPETGDRTPVTSGWSVPIGTAFDSKGQLHALAQGVGEVVRIDLDNSDTANNREVIAEIPVGWADNIAINDHDRIFISSASDSTVAEVLSDGSLRTVVPGQFELPGGVAVIGDTLYTANLGQVVGWNRDTRQQTSMFRAPFGVTAFPPTTSVVAWGEHLVLMSILSGQLMVWDPVTNTPIAQTLLVAPNDAEPFRGDLLVTQGSGDIVRLSPDLEVVEVVANVPGAAGIASRGGSVFVTDNDDGTVVQIMGRGQALGSPVEIYKGFTGPEGIHITRGQLFIIEGGGTQSLKVIEMSTGKRWTIARGLGFQTPTPLGPFGWFNDVTVDGKDIYVNADRANVIYEFEGSHYQPLR